MMLGGDETMDATDSMPDVKFVDASTAAAIPATFKSEMVPPVSTAVTIAAAGAAGDGEPPLPDRPAAESALSKSVCDSGIVWLSVTV
jgi:hypothetical protein